MVAPKSVVLTARHHASFLSGVPPCRLDRKRTGQLTTLCPYCLHVGTEIDLSWQASHFFISAHAYLRRVELLIATLSLIGRTRTQSLCIFRLLAPHLRRQQPPPVSVSLPILYSTFWSF